MAQTYKPRVWTVDSKSTTESRMIVDEVSETLVPYYKMNTVPSATGSAYYESGNTKVICAVYGPKPSSRSQFHANGIVTCDVKFAPFATSTRRSTQSRTAEPADLQLSSSLQEALSAIVQLDKFPNHEVQVCVEILQSEGNEVAAAICSASLALVDSGLEMYDIVSASTVVRICITSCLPPHNHVIYALIQFVLLSLVNAPRRMYLTSVLSLIRPPNTSVILNTVV